MSGDTTTPAAPAWTDGWHFATVAADGLPRERLGGRRLIVAGETLTIDGEPVPCVRGLHASASALDALSYARDEGDGLVATRVRLSGRIVYGDDKAAASERTALWGLTQDETDAVLRTFARRVAMDVLPLWPDAPDVVRRYLETGDEGIRAAAWSAAGAAAWSDARAAAWSAAGAAAWSDARAAARVAAWSAAWSAARAAARAAWAAAGDAKRGLYAGWLAEMLTAAHEAQADANGGDDA